MKGLKDILLELLRDAKSRKFLLVVGYGALIVLNEVEGWNMKPVYFLYTLIAVGLFVTVEGIADIITRYLEKK